MAYSRKMKMGVLLFLCCVCSLTPIYQTQMQSPNITDLTFKNMDFAITLYRQISGSHDNNIFFSPLSISAAFGAVSLAADGLTRDEILKGLNLAQLEREDRPQLIPELFQYLNGNITQDGSLKLDQGTALFVQLGFEVERVFCDQIKKFFDADIKSVDFSDPRSSVALINEYIYNKTGNKVTEMITSVDQATQLMLINTIFFQGEWQIHFNPNHTANERFYVDNYNIVQVPMMFREDKYHTMEDAALKAKVLRLPYRNGVSMLIVLPDKGRDYTTIDDEITAERFLFWIKNLKQIKLEVQLPKFKLEQSYAVHNILQDLGIISVFRDSANLTRLSKEFPLKVSEVLHKAVIEVDEKGTTAAAATTVGFTAYSLPPTFIVNRPFFFFIYHEATNSLLFMGRVIDPTKH